MTAPCPILISRSAVATRKLCPMKRYYNYHHPHPDAPPGAPGGIVPTQDRDATHLAKQRGLWLHGCMEHLLAGSDWQAWLTAETDPQRVAAALTNTTTAILEEQVRLVRRAVIGWVAQRGYLLDLYTPISSEEEWTWALSPFVGQTLRLDQIWRNKTTGALLIVDFKTLSRADSNWIARLRESDQTHLYVQALTERTGEQIEGIQYEGIVIGKFEDGIQKSPFTRAYSRAGGLLFPKWQAGSSLVSTEAMTDDEWLAWAHLHRVLSDCYITTGPLRPTAAQLTQTQAATAQAELTWADTIAQVEAADPRDREAVRHRLIERSSDACLKFGAGYACAYAGLCWKGEAVTSETFAPRVDHHAPLEEAPAV